MKFKKWEWLGVLWKIVRFVGPIAFEVYRRYAEEQDAGGEIDWPGAVKSVINLAEADGLRIGKTEATAALSAAHLVSKHKDRVQKLRRA